jgi:SAM-dependent methyltransferase
MNEASDRVEAIRRHYDRTPYDFREIRKEIFRASLTREALLFEHLPGNQVVDVGCSTSYLGEVLREEYPNFAYLGVDLLPAAVAAARGKGLRVVEGNNLSLDLPDGCSDLTVSEGVIHHTPDPVQCFRELVRITRTGGMISLYVYDRHHPYYYLYKAGAAARRLDRSPVGRELLERILFPAFNLFLVQPGSRILFPGQRPVSREVAWNIFSDMILTPVAHFFTRKQILALSEENGLDRVRFKYSINRQGLMFLFRKR